MIRAFLKKEQRYLAELPDDQRRLLTSFTLFAFASPMISVFSNTYLWRLSEDVGVLVLFNVGHYAGLTIGFFLNGLLLKRFFPAKLYTLGTFFQGLVPLLLVLLKEQAVPLALPIGLLLGIAAGFYWANRNYLTSAVTIGPSRFKYISLESTFGIMAGIVSPLLIGWGLVLGERVGWYSSQSGYLGAAILGLILLVWSGRSVWSVKTPFVKITQLFIPNTSPSWTNMRVLDFVNGIHHTFEALLALLVLLFFLGLEDAVGTVISVASILSALGMYLMGKRASNRDQVRILELWTVITFVGKIAFTLFTSAVGAVMYHTTEGFSKTYRWASMASLMYEAVDKNHPEQNNGRFAYLLDREFFLNAGRLCGLLLLWLAYTTFPDTTIRFGLFATLIGQLVMIALAKRLIRFLN